ncbi:Tetratricopeptide repeat protein [Rubripirellula tenax]|uniref:Tetratricopeptide repeat protein n=1 Tax=Rubripirellula tenax TaxID=2528015 RepID=A0A5C6EZ92_9BACT|nr:tetratricopeptide repeat protein [Rubripirellula tenax]TWU54478.1 Tetratricopeptide repeat protein [Rubripirellula tenax]
MSTTGADWPRNESKRSTNRGRAIKSNNEATEQYNAAREAKLEQRRYTWKIDARLLIVSLVVFAVVGIAATCSYFYFSASTAQTFLKLADAAEQEKDFAAQAKWLQRYSLTNPDDAEAPYRMAVAADRGATLAIMRHESRDEVGQRIDASRRALSLGIGPVSRNDRDNTADLRRRLIRRLLQLGGQWNREVEQQVIMLNPPEDDTQAVVSTALSLVGQLDSGFYQMRRPDSVPRNENYWGWLCNQKVGYVLATAFEKEPNNVDLASFILTTPARYPEQFSFVGDEAGISKNVLAELQTKATEALKAAPSSRAKLILSDHLSNSNQREEAIAVLQQAAVDAQQRLVLMSSKSAAKLIETAGEPGSLKAASDLVGDDPKVFISPYIVGPGYWDYLVVYDSARSTAIKEPKKALETLTSLLELELPSAPPDVEEKAYLLAGSLMIAAGQTERAVALLNKGVEQVGDQSVVLLSEVARVQRRLEDFSSLKATTEKLRLAVDRTRASMATDKAAQMDQAQRVALGRHIDLGEWTLKVMRATLAESNGDSLSAMKLFDEALHSSVGVSDVDRVSVAEGLAKIQSDQGMWDQAANSLDQASQLFPGDARLHMMAANVWLRAGNSEQASRHWQSSSKTPSPSVLITQLQSQLQQQFRRLPGQRDFDAIRREVEQIRKLLKASYEGELGADEKAALDKSGRESLLRALTLLKAIDLTIPPGNQVADTPQSILKTATSLDEFAAEHPNDVRLQSFVTEQLAQLGEGELAMKAVERLEESTGADSIESLVAKASVVAFDEPIAAAILLLDSASENEIHEADLLQYAAGYAAQGGDSEVLYKALTRLNQKRQSLSTLFGIVATSKVLPEGSELLAINGKQVTAAELSAHWQEQLRQREGESGTYWRFARAVDLVGKHSNLDDVNAKDAPALIEAQKLVRNVLIKRPRWGEAISLDGTILALLGKRDEAVVQLRRGIAAGDNQIQSRNLLWKLLILLDRGDEAEAEIRNTSLVHQADLDPNAAVRIGLAQSRGDFEKSMKLAQDSANENPNDFLPQMILAITGTKAIENTVDQQRRSALLEVTRQAIDRAAKLATKESPQIFGMQLELAFVLKDEKSVSKTIDDVIASEIDALPKARLLARAYFSKKEFEATLEQLTIADRLDPSSRSQLDLADVYAAMNQPEGEIDALRNALQRDPASPSLRNRLAQKMVVSTDGTKVLDWNAISELLSGEDANNSTNQLMYAVLLGREAVRAFEADKTSTVDGKRLEQSQTILRNLILDDSVSSDDARRFLAMLLEKIATVDNITDKSPAKLDDEIRSLYSHLYDRGYKNPVDVYRYSQYLLSKNVAGDQSRLKRLADELKISSPATVQALKVALQVAERLEQTERYPTVIGEWADGAINATAGSLTRTADAAAIYSTAGSAMVDLGLVAESVVWFEKAYKTDQQRLATYVVALTRVNKRQEAIRVCLKHFDANSDPVSATLLLETLLSVKDPQRQLELAKDNAEVVDRAVAMFQGDSRLLESFGTLRMAQGDFEGAVIAFQNALKKDPLRIRTLNNLAMAFSEIPGRESEGLVHIETALELTNDDPELLDTKGVILMASGRTEDAEATFEKAFSKSNEPRHLFHVIVSQLIQGKESQAQLNWGKIDLSKLDPMGLTRSERIKLEKIKTKFDTSL